MSRDGESPADRFGHLFELIGDPVVEIELVDAVPVVRAVNPAFEEVFGYDREAVLGASLNEFIVPSGDEQADAFDRRTAAGKPNFAMVSRETADGPREFLYRGVPYERDGRQFGFAIYSDVTDERRYERHLRVLHRLLRHDLRNDLQVVLGAGARLADSDDPEVARLGERVREHADRLVSVAEDTRTVEQVLVGDRETATVDVADYCRGVVAEFPDLAVETDLPERAPVDGLRWLRRAVAALVENSAVHVADPTVRVTVERTPEAVVVRVADDGPGIPDPARAPVFEDREITALEHGSGIGLWLVRWVVEACGGRVEYDRADGWTVVSLHLRPADAARVPA
jgi:PAS domain S-box-containing protein